MLKKWKEKWQVSWLQFTLIIGTFALGGSLCGIIGKKLLILTNIEKGVVYFVLYIITITIIWPFCVIFVSIPLGQFKFFKKYLYNMWRKISTNSSVVNHQSLMAKRIAIFASGAGSNAEKIIDYLKGSAFIKVGLIVCNKPEAGVLTIAAKHNIPTLLIDKVPFFKGDTYVITLKNNNIDFIVLAGFLWKIPLSLIQAYPNKIINIHPALLPKYGGKGMYGHFIHQTVLTNGETESGITIHYVNEHFDEGKKIFQIKCQVSATDTPDTLAAKIHQLEHQYYPKIVEETVLGADYIN